MQHLWATVLLDHILTLRFAHQNAIVQERTVCRYCTELLFVEREDDRLQCQRDLRVGEYELAVLKKQIEDEPECPPT